MLILAALIKLLCSFLCISQLLVLMHLRNPYCWRVLFLLIDTYSCICHLLDVRPCTWSLNFCHLVHFSKFLPSPFYVWSRIFYKGNFPIVFLFDEILQQSLVSGSFLVILRSSFLIFSSSPFV